MPTEQSITPDPEIVRSLLDLGLLGDVNEAKFVPLAGGVSSDIWKIESSGRVFCVKRALAKLKVEADWFAPVERNRFEVIWYRVANDLVPGSAPKILAHDEEAMLCAMEFLDPAEYSLWKDELRDGRADPEQAATTGDFLARIHSGTANNRQIHAWFSRTDIFHAIRLEPYLEAMAASHPDLKERLFGLSERTAAVHTTMIHGDVSPKNIFMGPNGPVFLDAECACVGDPAFDLAFCLNHFLLKCLWTPEATGKFLECFEAMTSGYLAKVDWEPLGDLEDRAASLVPGLFLARVDGKSPVEYVIEERDKNKVRNCARSLLQRPSGRLAEVVDAWNKELAR